MKGFFGFNSFLTHLIKSQFSNLLTIFYRQCRLITFIIAAELSPY